MIGGCAYFKSDAAIAVVSRLPGWSWTRLFAPVPRPIRDWLYDRIALSRYRLFGRTESCLMPAPEIVSRFVSDDRPAGDR